MDNWPGGLQQRLEVAGFQYLPGNTRVASDMDIGPKKVRNRYTEGIDLYQCQVTLDFAEVQTFKTFYKTTLANGTLPFLFVDPFEEDEAVFRFAPDQDPVIRPIGGRKFTLSMQWERLSDVE